jgi:hydroxymethylpyrimidine pyrophosphatase-like HAD family hydrolase
MAKDRGGDVDEMMAGVLSVLGDRAGVTHSSSFGLLEIAAPGVTKATGLAEVARSHGIDADQVLAVGDMPNDVPMLVWAGHSYAVGNAHPAVKAVVDEVIGRNDEDAVAVLIESVLAG